MYLVWYTFKFRRGTTTFLDREIVAAFYQAGLLGIHISVAVEHIQGSICAIGFVWRCQVNHLQES